MQMIPQSFQMGGRGGNYTKHNDEGSCRKMNDGDISHFQSSSAPPLPSTEVAGSNSEGNILNMQTRSSTDPNPGRTNDGNCSISSWMTEKICILGQTAL